MARMSDTRDPFEPDAAGPEAADDAADPEAAVDADAQAAEDADAAADAQADADAEAADGSVQDDRGGLLSRLEPGHWLWFGAAVIVVAALGFLAGSQWGSPLFDDKGDGANTVNAAGAAPGTGQSGATPIEGEGDGARYDANIQGPHKGADLTSADSRTDVTILHRRDEHDPFALGAVDAPVVISIFSDFECPFCAKFTLETQPRIISDYVEKGLVRLEWNDAPLGGEHAIRAAEAGRAAAAQGMFWEFQHAAFEKAHEKGNGHPEFTDDELVGIAEAAGVPDIERFRSDLDGHVWLDAVHAAGQHAQLVGVSGTPAFIVGDQGVTGAQPLGVFHDAIEVQLFKASAGL